MRDKERKSHVYKCAAGSFRFKIKGVQISRECWRKRARSTRGACKTGGLCNRMAMAVIAMLAL